MREAWNPDFANAALFQPLAFALAPLLQRQRSAQDWPSLDEYQAYADTEINPRLQNSLRIVAQAGKAKNFEQTYLARIYQHGDIQTRLYNWHDLFQLVSWRLFPRSKTCVVERHYACAQRRWQQQQQGIHAPGRRSVEENALSLWDEGGVLLLCANEDVPSLVRQFRWRELFLRRRDQLSHKLRMLVFGHALLDKLRHPYIGITGNAILLPLPQQALTLQGEDLFAFADERLAQLLSQNQPAADSVNQQSAPANDANDASGFTPRLTQPRDLQPFPLLGMPGLWPDNDKAAFYDNTRYFRPGRRQGQTSATSC